MTSDNPPQHSGSRWEPPTTTGPAGGQASPSTLPAGPGAVEPTVRKDRRRRGPLLAVLAAVLTLGASTAGIAYVQAAQEPTTNDPAAATDSPQDHGPGLGDGNRDGRRGDRPHDGDGGNGGGDGRGSRDDNSSADGTTGGLPS